VIKNKENIAVIIPTYNGLKHLETCFDSLRKQTFNSVPFKSEVRIILVDNGSSDGSIEYTNIHYPEVEIIKLDKNYGFAKAVNEGIKYSLKDENIKRILLLNNDIECTDNFLEEMLKGFTEEYTGSVACKMMNFYNRNTIDDAGDFIKLIGSPYARGHAEEDKGQYDTAEYIFGACAGAAFYRREVFESIGFFDEDFFAYYEDVDFSLRMQLAGYKCYYNPKAVCYHKRGATGNYVTGWMTMLCEKNLITLRIKNYPLSLYFRLTPLFMVGRIKRYYGFLRAKMLKVFMGAIKGYIMGLANVPKSIFKRRKIQSMRKVDNEYIYSIFTYKKDKYKF
jgi:GT2 family glycosyltransferase